MFNLHFVLPGKIGKKYSQIYRRLFNDRISGDYDDFIFFDKEIFDIVRKQVDDFLILSRTCNDEKRSAIADLLFFDVRMISGCRTSGHS